MKLTSDEKSQLTEKLDIIIGQISSAIIFSVTTGVVPKSEDFIEYMHNYKTLCELFKLVLVEETNDQSEVYDGN
jgi:hypothetical protein